jgi:lipid II:glycine glycyltransferase (peptidoglycan interpeptide bridge formation enzyme)
MQNIFQSNVWEEFKLKTGYQKSFWIEGVLILLKKLPFGQTMLYAPMIQREKLDVVKSEVFRQRIREIARRENSIFCRVELDIPCQDDSCALLPSPYIKAFEEVQPEHTLVLDLTKSEDKLFAEMKQKGRYSIRNAVKFEVKVANEKDLSGALDIFFELYSSTAKRHRISYRNRNYFENLVSSLHKDDLIKVYTAYKDIEGKYTPLASAIVAYSGETAIYMFGASSDEHKNFQAPCLLQWRIIQESHHHGFKKYDFFGIAPSDDPKHPWAGITRFKKQFGGVQVNIAGSFDLILKPFEYKIFEIAEKIRRR